MVVSPPDWISIAPGEFLMGGGPRADQNPRHPVRLGRFRLARAPVTRMEYQIFLEATGRTPAEFWDEPRFSHPHCPAVGVSWHDATAYCEWLSPLVGEPVRLPTEAEWERAARADRDATWPWGDEPPESLPDFALRWQEGPEPVDAYPSRHPWGFLGLGENVHEWCSDWYDARYYSVSPMVDPSGPSEPTRRKASRGGAWRHRVPVCSCAHRSSIPPGFRYSDYGFRVARRD